MFIITTVVSLPPACAVPPECVFLTGTLVFSSVGWIQMLTEAERADEPVRSSAPCGRGFACSYLQTPRVQPAATESAMSPEGRCRP